MAILKPKRGSGLPTGLQQNELAIDILNKRIYLGNTGGTGDIISSHITSYVTSVNGLTGVVTNIATLTDDQVFDRLQRFTTGISAAGATFFGLTRFTAGISASGATFSGLSRFNSGISSAGATISGNIVFTGTNRTITGYGLQFVGNSSSGIVPSNTILLPNDGGSPVITSGNGNIQVFDSSGNNPSTTKITFNTQNLGGLDEYYSQFSLGPQTDPGTNLNYNAYLPADNGTIALTKNVVSSFNGLTGAVTGVTTGTANTFVQLQRFANGISASGGITFNSVVTANGYRYSSSVFETKTSGFTLAAADSGKIFVMNNSATSTINIPTGLGVGFSTEFLVIGAGRITLSANASVTLNMYDSTVFPINRVQLICYSTDTYLGTYSYSNY